MMPPALANPGKGRFAEPHLEFMAQHKSDNEFLAARLGAFAPCYRSGENVGRVRGILLPVDVVVVHATDHQRISQRCGDRVNTFAGPRPATSSRTCSAILTSCC